MTYTIESDIDIPDKIIKESKYPLGLLKIGDSFEFDVSEIKRVGAAAGAYGKRHHKRFMTRTIGGKGRCWRMELKQ